MTQRHHISAVMSVPRLGFMDNFACAHRALTSLGIEVSKATGAFWGQCLTRIFEQVIAARNPEWLLVIDYDTIFQQSDVETMIRTLEAYPEIDALCPLQAHRKENRPLLTLPPGADGKSAPQVPISTFWRDVTQLQTGHFGLTMIRADKLKALKKPWFYPTPDADGGWGEGHEDDDSNFWLRWWDAHLSLFSANRVVIGHAELMIRWAGADMNVIYQHPNEFWAAGKPDGVWK